VNSCGRQIFCLPASSTIAVVAKAATLSTDPPQAELTASGFDGIVDVASNSLDGNGDGTAQGSNTDAVAGDDRYDWSFGTSDRPNLAPPGVRSTIPPAGNRSPYPAGSSRLPVDHEPQTIFDSVMQASTIVSDVVLLRSTEPAELADTFWFTPYQVLLTADGRVASGTDIIAAGRIGIAHRPYIPATSTDPGATAPEYYPFLYSGLQNVYQNCFNPASSETCRGGPNCCDNRTSLEICPYPTVRTP
jgi:hypothetical protein